MSWLTQVLRSVVRPDFPGMWTQGLELCLRELKDVNSNHLHRNCKTVHFHKSWYVTFLMKRGSVKKKQTHSNDFQSRSNDPQTHLNVFSFFLYPPFSPGRSHIFNRYDWVYSTLKITMNIREITVPLKNNSEDYSKACLVSMQWFHIHVLQGEILQMQSLCKHLCSE